MLTSLLWCGSGLALQILGAKWIVTGGTRMTTRLNISPIFQVARTLVIIDLPVMAMVAALCLPVFHSGRQVSRWEGGGFVFLYSLYLACLIGART
ncbi:hypothetical protein LJR030_002064 [Rhizobium sp. LjRoot30]|uniref:hypothetical protein n=1 Tax=Rhizobium sp. LjRoot30 TaxID=3342320 RepID=UPI003ECFB060